MRIDRSSFWLLAAVAALLTPDRIHALPVLMATDGQSSRNISAVQELGHEVSTASLAAINAKSQAELAGFRTVIVSPDLNQAGYAQLRAAVADGGSLQLYVATGGTLVLNVAGRVGSQQNIAPGGVDYVYGMVHNAETFATPDHPYLTGQGFSGQTLTPANFELWLNTDHGHLDPLSLPPNAITVLTNTNGGTPTPIEVAPSFVEYPYGQGRVVVTVLAVGWAIAGDANGAPTRNLFQYAVPEPSCLLLLGPAALLALPRRGPSGRSRIAPAGHPRRTR